MAKEQGLDLVMVSATANPPVTKIIDYGKHKYQTEKREKEGKRKTQDVKGIKMSPRIAENDMQTLLKNARKFLGEGDKVRVTCQFRAREVTHPEIGLNKMNRFAEALSETAIVERPPILEGKQMVMILLPKPSTQKSHAKDQDKQDGREAVQDHGNGQNNEA
jgi:translation initiation factor IF-3